jgi:enoyl-CoA hydratase/carnithine racemase
VKFTEIEYDVADHIATIALNRPEKMNAGTATMVRELVSVLDVVDADDQVRAVILTGRGKAFCAGADLSGGGHTGPGRRGSGHDAPVRMHEAGDHRRQRRRRRNGSDDAARHRHSPRR